jgi:hypothetical protein
VAQPVPDGLGLTYNNLPFYINVTVQPQGQAASGLAIQGDLNGSIQGPTNSSVVATVTSIQPTGPGTLPFPVGAVNVGPQALEPSGVNGGVTPFIGQVNMVPEPSSLAVMGILAGWAAFRLGIRRTGRKSR